MGCSFRGVHLHGRVLRQLRDGPGDRHNPAGRHLYSRLSSQTRSGSGRTYQTPDKNRKPETDLIIEEHMTLPSGTRETKSMLLNIGPSHPAMHGVIRLITELEGEKVINV